MADITKCRGIDCPIKESCYRYTAEDSKYRQSWFFDDNVGENTNEGFKCDMYWGEKSKYIYNQLKNITNGEN